jgi:5-amino-6-(5-phosphoribosylamino)uracil reductase
MSVDGYIDDSSPERLLLSNDEDFDRVDEVRATCDAILVGANTVRRDDPRLLVRSQARRQERVARGLPPSPAKVTLTTAGDLDPSSRFFAADGAAKIVYVASAVVDKLSVRLGETGADIEIVDAGDPVDLRRLLEDLAGRGVRRLMVEGGASVHTRFLQEDLVDELHLVMAPFFVGHSTAPRFVHDGDFPHDHRRRMDLAEVRKMGDVTLLRYLLS